MPTDPTGRSLEDIVARIQQRFDPGTTVTRREFIKNRLGIAREFDVVVRGIFGGHETLMVIECKDWKDKAGTPEMDAFIKKSDDVHANFRLMVSPKGFTAPAIVQAKDAGVGVYSLIPDDPEEDGFFLGMMAYGKVHYWKDIRIGFEFPGVKGELDFHPHDAQHEGLPIWKWVMLHLYQKFSTSDKPNPQFVFKFRQPLKVDFLGNDYLADSIFCWSERTVVNKKRFVQVKGEAFFDWKTQTVLNPPDKGLDIPLHKDILDWDDLEGPIPIEPFQMYVSRFLDQFGIDIPHIEKSEAADLDPLGFDVTEDMAEYIATCNGKKWKKPERKRRKK